MKRGVQTTYFVKCITINELRYDSAEIFDVRSKTDKYPNELRLMISHRTQRSMTDLHKTLLYCACIVALYNRPTQHALRALNILLLMLKMNVRALNSYRPITNVF